MMDNKPIAVFIPAPLRYDEWKRRFALHWVDGEPIGITHLYSEDLVRQQQAEIEALKVRLNPYQSITDTKIEPTVVSFTYPVTEHFEDEPQAEELHEILQSNAELTDEEIAVIGDKCFGTMSYELWLQTNEFARAILRKAQENDKLNPSTINIGGIIYQSGKEVK